MNKYVEALLLNNETDKLLSFLDKDFDKNSNLVLKTFLDIIIGKTDEDIELAFNTIYNSILQIDYENKLNIINEKFDIILSTISKMDINPDNIDDIKRIFIELKRKIKLKEKEEKENDLYSFFSNLIFETKNISLVKRLLKEHNVLDIKDKNNTSLFVNLLNYYISLSDEKEINYFYEIIDLALMIKKNNLSFDIYKEILENHKDKEHVKRVIDLLENDLIDFNLEKRYGIINNTTNSLSYLKTVNNHRLSYLNQEIITIDGKDSICLDDALYLRKNKNGTFTLFNYIADIPCLLDFNSLIVRRAFSQSETIYLPDKVIGMYPDNIANNLASLLACQKRNAIAYIVDFDDNYNIIPSSFKIQRGRIMSKRSLNYEEADAILNEDKDSNLKWMLNDLANIAMKLRKNNPYKETYRYIENSFEESVENASYFTEKYKTANIIQETAVLTNHLVAEYFKKLSLPYLYRNHLVDLESAKIANDLMKIKKFDINDPKYRKYYELIKNSYLTAYYSNENLGHNGLGFTSGYSHSTSPLRRAADSLNQFITYDVYFNGHIDDKNLYYWEDIIAKYAKHFNSQSKINELYISKYCYTKSRLLPK